MTMISPQLEIDFDDLAIEIMGSRVGSFAGQALYDDDGTLEEVRLCAPSINDKDVVLKRHHPDSKIWFTTFETALARRFAEDIGQWLATRYDRGRELHADLCHGEAA